MILVVLQCAWYHDGKSRPYKTWIKALWKSHTGRRLKEMLPEDVPFVICNASPQIGQDAGASFKADPAHVADMINRVKPTIVLGCGAIAHSALSKLDVEYIKAPHPAWRRLTKERTKKIRHVLEMVTKGDCDG